MKIDRANFTRRNQIIQTLKKEIEKVTQIKTFIDSDFFNKYQHLDRIIIISKQGEKIENLTLNCERKSRTLSLEITLQTTQQQENEEDIEIDKKLEELEKFLFTYKNEEFKIVLDQINFNFENEDSDITIYFATFSIEINYLN